MKVLTIQEPYATLIMNGFKKIETRSFKTNYRGELYIHASKSNAYLKNIRDSKILHLLEGYHLNYGKIICKCRLVDCIFMTASFVEKIKQENELEYQLGIYEEGRYAWILEDIKPLNDPILAKGQLNIWNYIKE